MRLAVIGDIHSNIYALESVIEDINTSNVDFILCTGDLVGYAPFPNEVIDLVRQNHILTIQGNYDKAIGNCEIICGCDYKDEKQLEKATMSVMFTNDTVNETNREYLKQLPKQIRIKAGEYELLMVHGSPRKINEYLYEESKAAKEVTSDLKEDILVCGHTHKPYYNIVNGKHVINAGSVGKPKHGNPNATYVIIDIIQDEIKVKFKEITYDYEKTAKAIEALDSLPNEFARLLRLGQG